MTPEPTTARRLACTVALNEPCGTGLVRMRLACPELARAIRPGQFFDLRVPFDPTQMLRLPFSWSDADVGEGWVEFAFAVVGDGTARLAVLPVGTPCDLLGPAGHGWEVPAGLGRALVVAGGTGAVPCMPLVRELAGTGAACDLVLGAASADRLVYADEAGRLGARAVVVTEDGSRGGRGTASEAAASLMREGAYDAVFACGPEDMMREVAALAREVGAPCQVSMERLMACGFGACTTCLVDTVDGRQGACMKGPVFDAGKVVW